MHTKDLIRHIAENSGVSKTEAERMVRTVVESIPTLLTEQGDSLIIRNFGVFTRKLRKARPARNPRTGDYAEVCEKEILHFRASRTLEF